MSFSADFLDAAHEHAFGNHAEILASSICGCFSCLATFPSKDVWEWIRQGDDQDDTGFCPYCMLDTVIGDASGLLVNDQNFLRAVNDKFFGGPPFHDQTKNPVPISRPGDWKYSGPNLWVLERQNENSRDA